MAPIIAFPPVNPGTPLATTALLSPLKTLALRPETRVQASHHAIDNLAQSCRKPICIRNLLRAHRVRDVDRRRLFCSPVLAPKSLSVP